MQLLAQALTQMVSEFWLKKMSERVNECKNAKIARKHRLLRGFFLFCFIMDGGSKLMLKSCDLRKFFNSVVDHLSFGKLNSVECDIGEGKGSCGLRAATPSSWRCLEMRDLTALNSASMRNHSTFTTRSRPQLFVGQAARRKGRFPPRLCPRLARLGRARGAANPDARPAPTQQGCLLPACH